MIAGSSIETLFKFLGILLRNELANFNLWYYLFKWTLSYLRIVFDNDEILKELVIIRIIRITEYFKTLY